MAKKSKVQRELKLKRSEAKYRNKRKKLKAIINDKSVSLEERFSAALKLASLPLSGARTRQKNRCGLTGRPRGYYRKFNLSRIALRELAREGALPGLIKASW